MKHSVVIWRTEYPIRINISVLLFGYFNQHWHFDRWLEIIELFLLRSQACLGVLFSSLSSSFWVSRMLFSNDFFELDGDSFSVVSFLSAVCFRHFHFPEFRLICSFRWLDASLTANFWSTKRSCLSCGSTQKYRVFARSLTMHMLHWNTNQETTQKSAV